MTCRTAWFGLTALLIAFGAISSAAHAQQYPDRPIRIIVPVPPGGSLDGVPRAVSQYINAQPGWTTVIDNRPGAGTGTGTIAGKQAAPDGYTLTAINGNSHGSLLSMKRDVGFDPINDFEPIILVADAPMVLLVRADLPVRTVPEFIELLRKRPGELNFGSAGIGSQHHLATAMFLDRAGLPPTIATHVPARGLALAITDLLSGSVQFMISSVGPAWQHVDAGKLRALATTGPKRLARMPDIPTMVELGFRDFEMLAWSGLAAPKGTPDAVLARWNELTNKSLTDPEVLKQIANFDFEPRGGTRAEFADFIKREYTRYRNLGESAGLMTQ